MNLSKGISVLRSFATIFVVLFHSLGYYTYAWPYNGVKVSFYHSFNLILNQITMPIFFVISAYIFGIKKSNNQYNNTSLFFKNKTIRLLVPYLIWSVFQLLLFHNQLTFSSIINGSLHLWFILVLFLYFSFFYFFSKFLINLQKNALIILLFAFISISVFFNNDYSFLCINGFTHYIPFFFFGLLLSLSKKNDILIPKEIIYFFSGVVILIIFTLKIHINNHIDIIIRECASLIIIYFLFNIIKSIKQIKNGLLNKIISEIDKNSFGIYIIHHIIIWYIVQQKTIQPFLNNHFIIAPLGLFLITICLSWSISKIITSNKYTRIILGEKNNENSYSRF